MQGENIYIFFFYLCSGQLEPLKVGMKYWEGKQGRLGQGLAVGAMLQPFWSCVAAACWASKPELQLRAKWHQEVPCLCLLCVRLKEAKLSLGGQTLYTHKPTGAFGAGEDEAKA